MRGRLVQFRVVREIGPIRLAAQDAALSRQKQGFESPMGHRLPHAFRADGSFIFTFEEAVSALVNRLYPGSPTPLSPQSQSTPKKVDRNAEIRARYAAGMSVPDLAREYGISKNRVYQILRGKRR